MKSARERADALWPALPSSAQVAIDLNYRRASLERNPHGTGKKKWLRDVALAFDEHASDQRHVVAVHVQQVAAKNAHPFVRDSASAMHHAAVNAPAPGEET